VQAEWETAGALIVASLVILVFGFGLYRNIAKRRRERKEARAAAAIDTAQADAAGPDD
jgi:type II secretory pathway pseudopilin PulG